MTLIHLHIAKTGGTSLNSMIKHAFPKRAVLELTHPTPGAMQQIPWEDLPYLRLRDGGYDYISGHVPLEIHPIFPGSRLITTIRNPIDRINSFFHYQLDDVGRYMKGNRPLTFEEYVRDGIDVQLHNYQTRVLCGLPDVEFMGRGQGRVGCVLHRDNLEKAKQTLSRLFLVAPMEKLVELGLMARREFGWPMRKIQSERMNSSKPPEVPPQLYTKLKGYNLLDLELHDWVTRRFVAGPIYDRLLYAVTNAALRTAGRVVPWHLRKQIASAVLGWY